MTNTLAYCGIVLIVPVKSFIVQAPGVNIMNFLSLSLEKIAKKLEGLSLENIFRLV